MTGSEQEILLTGKGLLLTTILLPHEEGDKILVARDLVAKRLAQNGLRQRDLAIPGIPFVHPWMAIAHFIQTLDSNTVLAAEFVDWAYQKGFYSDADSFSVLDETKRS